MAAPATQQEAIQQFIDLANEMKNDGVSIEVVSSALMRACAVYSTYVVTGNDGALHQTGVEKLQKIFGEQVQIVQQAKMERAGVQPPDSEQEPA